MDTTLPTILKSWDVEAVMNEASSEFLRVAKTEKLEKGMMESLARFGPLQSYGGASGEACLAMSCCDWIRPTATYQAEVMFEREPATIFVKTVRRDDRWKIADSIIRTKVRSE